MISDAHHDGTSSMDPQSMDDAPSNPTTETEPPQAPLPTTRLFEQLLTGGAQRDALCSRGNQDPVAQAFCRDTSAPQISSLRDLQKLLGLDFANPDGTSGRDGNPAFALIGHSPSLSARVVSPINPRAIVFTPPDRLGIPREGAAAPNDRYIAMAFTRGEQFVEIAARDTTTDDKLRFYLLAFEQSCNETGCTATDLFSPDVEEGFTNYSLYEDLDLLNTPMDCTRCHQADGPSSDKSLLMQQLQAPWTHFFSGFSASGQTLIDDYYGAHTTDEVYGGIPGSMIGKSDPEALQMLVENNGFLQQPVEYPGLTIEQEVVASNPEQPYVNMPMGESQTWNMLKESLSQNRPGVQLAYHDAKVSDMAVLADMSANYAAYMEGKTRVLPDLSKVFLEEAQPALGFRPYPNVSGEELLRQACGRCHNDQVDPRVSRSRFNAFRIDELSPEVKRTAIERMSMHAGEQGAMPPPKSVDLTPEEVARALEALR